MAPWLRGQRERLPGKSETARAIRPALKTRAGLSTFLADGRVARDTHMAERAIKTRILTSGTGAPAPIVVQRRLPAVTI